MSAAYIQVQFRLDFFMILFVWFDSLRPINNLSVIKGRVFLGWTSTKLGLMFLLKDTTQWRRWGSNPRPFGLESSTLPLSHCAPNFFFHEDKPYKPSDLGPHCLQYRLPKNISRWEEQTTKIMTGGLKVKYGKHGMHALLREKHHRNFSDIFW